MTSHLATLLRKDVRLHGRGFLLVMAGLVALGFVVARNDGGNHDRNVPFFFNLTLISSALWAEWLVAREKTKETFGWLRTLPISDFDIAVGKFLLAAIATVLTWTLLSLLFMRPLFFPARLGLWFVAVAGCVTVASLVVACRWRFGPKLGQMAPFGLLFLLIMPLVVLPGPVADGVERSLLAALQTPAGAALVVAFLALVAVGIVLATIRWVRASETPQLIE